MVEVTCDLVRSRYDYDPETGGFFWRYRPELSAWWNATFVGTLVGVKQKDGYLFLKIDDQRYAAHRIAWLWCYGEWPKHVTDHINEVRHENWIKNLRDIPLGLNVKRKGQRPEKGVTKRVNKDGSERWSAIVRDPVKGWTQHTHLTFEAAMANRLEHLARHKAEIDEELKLYESPPKNIWDREKCTCCSPPERGDPLE